MASKRMFNTKIVCSDSFLELSATAQALYFQIAMKCDDDGFCNTPRMIARMCGANEAEDLKMLIDRKFLLEFSSGVVVLKHWFVNNYIRKERHTRTLHQREFNQLYIDDDNVYHFGSGDKSAENVRQNAGICQPNAENMAPQYRLGESSIEENSIEEISKGKGIALLESSGTCEAQKEVSENEPPTFDNVLIYFSTELHCQNSKEILKFYNWYNSRGWTDKAGNPVTDWKSKARLWHSDQR